MPFSCQPGFVKVRFLQVATTNYTISLDHKGVHLRAFTCSVPDWIISDAIRIDFKLLAADNNRSDKRISLFDSYS